MRALVRLRVCMYICVRECVCEGVCVCVLSVERLLSVCFSLYLTLVSLSSKRVSYFVLIIIKKGKEKDPEMQEQIMSVIMNKNYQSLQSLVIGNFI